MSAAPAAPGRAAVPAGAAGTSYLTLSAAAFAPDHLGDTTDDYYNLWDSATLTDSSAARCYNAGLTLPGNAVIKSMTVYYTQGATGSLYVELNRQSLADHSSTVLATLDSTTTTTATYTSTTELVAKSVAAVNYQQYAYGFGVCPSDDATFSDVQIAYKLG